MTESDVARGITLQTPGVQWQPYREADLDALMALIAEMELADNPPYRTSVEEVAEIFTTPHRAYCGWIGDTLIAYAIVRVVTKNGPQAICSGGVGVKWRGQGIGRQILVWEVATARQLLADCDKPAQIVCFQDRGSSVSPSRMYELGFRKSHSYIEMRRDLNQPVEVVSPGQYLEIVPFSEALDDRVRRAHNTLISMTTGAPAQDMESWTANRAFFAPEWSFIALDKSSDVAQVAGYLLSARYEQDWEALGWTEGYTELVGVLPEYVDTDVAEALVTSAVAAYRESGMQRCAVSLSQDNRTEVIELYTRLGYAVTGGSTVWVIDVISASLHNEVANENRRSVTGKNPS